MHEQNENYHPSIKWSVRQLIKVEKEKYSFQSYLNPLVEHEICAFDYTV